MKHPKAFRPADIKTCMGKNCYNTRQEAEAVKEEQELRDFKGELKIDVYRCQYCSKFHLTQVN